jgi:O-antigen/teichoic acid export membrane protein
MKRLKRVGWSSIDQGLSSISNLLLSVLVARVSTLDEFGIFGIAFAIYQFGLGSSRAFLGEPALIRIAKGDSAAGTASNLLGASVWPGLLGLLACGAAGIFAGPSGTPFLAFAVGFPILMAVDSARYWLFANGRPASASLIDATWLVAQLATYGVAVLVGFESSAAVLWTWVAGAAIAAILFMLMQRALPSLRGGWEWIKSTRDLSFRYWGEYLTISGTQQSVIYFSVIFSGLSASAALRGGQVLIGPLSMISMGVAVVALPAMSHLARTGAIDRLPRRAVLVSGALLGSTLLYGAILVLVPSEVGEALLGASWTAGAAIVPLLLLQTAVSNVAYGATAALRALEAARLTFRLRLTTLPVSLVAIFIGAMNSPSGAVIGAIAGGSIQLACWWIALVVVTRRRIGDPE